MPKLYRITDKDGAAFLTQERRLTWYNKSDYYTIDDNPILTSEEIAHWLDDEAENANYHGLVGAHVWLAEIIAREAGEPVAIKVMIEIADMGGLHEYR
jgi:hypothetical protein